MSNTTKQQKRLALVLDRMKALAMKDRNLAKVFSEEIEKLLEDLLDEDAFGTEGQNDPRGDFREYEWSLLSRVQGVDKP